MTSAGGEHEAIQAIVRIIREQKVLEKHQRSSRASVETLQDSMVYAYDQITAIVQAFMDRDG